MTTFRNHSAAIMRHLKDTGRPVILTVNGKAAAVVQDAAAYQRLLDLAAAANAAEGIRQGLAMSLGERKERWDAMIATIEQNDVTHWRESFIAALANSGAP